MLNQTILVKIQERVNKLASSDYDNIHCWQAVEAFNKAQVEWVRRQLVGTNILRQGDEQSERRIDDLNVLLRTRTLNMTQRDRYFESNNLPFLTGDDYMAFKRLQVNASSDCCTDGRLMTVYLVEEANVINYLNDEYKKPSFDWGETIATIVGRKIRIYTNNEFQIDSAQLMYYHQPRRIVAAGCADVYTGVTNPAVDVLSEFKDDIVEVIIDDAVSIILGDIENYPNSQRAKQMSENNN
jgi:hypothetical protein